MSSSDLDRRETVTSILPDDIIANEILPRASTKSLVRSSFVCKTWNNIISDPLFLNQHYKRAVELNTLHIMLVFNTSPVVIYSLDPENPTSTTAPDNINAYPPPFTSFNYGIGSCDALVCTRFNYGSKTISVWNAATRTPMTFPYHGHPSQSYGFIYDVTSCDYKLVTVTYHDDFHSSAAEVYSLDDGTKKLKAFIPYKMVPQKAGIVANGALHWLAFVCMFDHGLSEQVIVTFYPTRKTIKEMPIPAHKINGLDDVNLAQLGGSLSIVFSYNERIEVWLMKENGMESWSMCFLVPTNDIYCLSRPLRVVPLYITKKGDLILQINYKELFIYDKKQKSLKSIRIKYPENSNNSPFYAITLLDSLVDVRICHGGGQQFLGRKNKPESYLKGPITTLTHCFGDCRTENIRSDSAIDLSDEVGVYLLQIMNRYQDIVRDTSGRKLYKLLKECKMDLEAATLKFSHQALDLVLSELVPYMKRALEASSQQISGDAIAETLRTSIMGSDSASIASNGYGSAEGRASDSHASVSSASERLNHQLPRRNNGLYATVARLAILEESSKFDPSLKPEFEAYLQETQRDIAAKKLRIMNMGSNSAPVRQRQVENDSNASYGSIEGIPGKLTTLKPTPLCATIGYEGISGTAREAEKGECVGAVLESGGIGARFSVVRRLFKNHVPQSECLSALKNNQYNVSSTLRELESRVSSKLSDDQKERLEKIRSSLADLPFSECRSMIDELLDTPVAEAEENEETKIVVDQTNWKSCCGLFEILRGSNQV